MCISTSCGCAEMLYTPPLGKCNQAGCMSNAKNNSSEDSGSEKRTRGGREEGFESWGTKEWITAEWLTYAWIHHSRGNSWNPNPRTGKTPHMCILDGGVCWWTHTFVKSKVIYANTHECTQTDVHYKGHGQSGECKNHAWANEIFPTEGVIH